MENLLFLIPALACPIGMGLMMWMMASHMGGSKEDKQGEIRTEQPMPERSRISGDPDPGSRS